MEKPVAEAVDEEIGILNHLLEVENEALMLAVEATEEADKRRAVAKQKADAEYRAKYDELIQSLETWLGGEKEKCDAAQKAAFSEYEEKLKAMPRNVDEFYAFVDSLLIKK